MKKIFTTLFVKAVNANIKTETENACVFWGYQPEMPLSARKLKKIKKK